MMLEQVTSMQERKTFYKLIENWTRLLPRNKNLSDHYNGKIEVQNLGVAIPPTIANKLKKCGMQWCNQAVKRIADISVIEGFAFADKTPAGFDDLMLANEFIDQYDEMVPSQLMHGCAFVTTTGGDEKAGDPPVVFATYDALHASALYDYRRRRTYAGLVIADVDKEDPSYPIALTYYLPDGDFVEMVREKGGEWGCVRKHTGVGRCLMEVLRNDPDKEHPFGNSVITPSILTLEHQANAAFVRLVCTSEFAASLQRYILGADDEIFEGDTWKSTIASMIAVPVTDTPDGKLPSIGQFPQISADPQIQTIREMAALFASAASIPIHTLLYTEANPASAEAIEASRYDLVQKTRKLNRLNGHSIRNIVLMALSILNEKPIMELGDVARSFNVQWKNPLTSSIASSADAATKIAAEVPGFAGTKTYWQMLGFDSKQAEVIQAEVADNQQEQDVAELPAVGFVG